MAEYTLEPAELSFLLVTFGVSPMNAVSQQRNLSDAKEESDWIRTQWENGFRRFQERGWLTPNQDGKLLMDPEIALLGSIVVDPTIALSVSVYSGNNQAEIVTYSLSENEYIEQTRLHDGRYRFVNLENEDVMVGRIISVLHSVGVKDDLSEASAHFHIPANELDESVRLARIGRIEESTKLLAVYVVDIAQAQSVANFFQAATKSAEIAVKAPGGRLAESAGGLILLKSAQESRMLVHIPQFNSIMLEATNTHRIRFILREWLNANALNRKSSVVRNGA